jgi:hypothetical protein
MLPQQRHNVRDFHLRRVELASERLHLRVARGADRFSYLDASSGNGFFFPTETRGAICNFLARNRGEASAGAMRGCWREISQEISNSAAMS